MQANICTHRKQKKEMEDADTIEQAIAQTVEAAKTTVLVINEEGRGKSVIAQHIGASWNTRHRTGPS